LYATPGTRCRSKSLVSSQWFGRSSSNAMTRTDVLNRRPAAGRRSLHELHMPHANMPLGLMERID
jgi:hypothetical protein